MPTLHAYKEITTTGSPVKVLTVPADSVAWIKTLIITNKAAAAATVDLWSGDGSSANDYQITSIIVPASETLILNHHDIQGLHAISDIYAVTDQQPIRITIVAETT